MGEDGRASPSRCLLNLMPALPLATIDASVALRTSSGSRRSAVQFDQVEAYRNVLPSWRR
jgi:hypothetical protein